MAVCDVMWVSDACLAITDKPYAFWLPLWLSEISRINKHAQFISIVFVSEDNLIVSLQGHIKKAKKNGLLNSFLFYFLSLAHNQLEAYYTFIRDKNSKDLQEQYAFDWRKKLLIYQL